MTLGEEQLITEKELADPMCMNCRAGGQGDWSHAHKAGLDPEKRAKWSAKISEGGKRRWSKATPEEREAHGVKVSAGGAGRKKGNIPWNKGKKTSIETTTKQSESKRNFYASLTPEERRARTAHLRRA